MRRPCAYLPILVALAGGCFNPAGSSETSAGSTGSPEVTSSSTGDPTGTSTTPTTGSDGSTTIMTTGSSGPESSSSEPASTGVVPETGTTGTTGTSGTGETMGWDTSTTGVPSDCGNGLIEGSEACDDGGKVSGDGCSENCKREDLVVFVSAGVFTVAQLTNLEIADNLCSGMAQTSSVPPYAESKPFAAWLSDGKTSARDRIGHTDLPYRLLDGTKVADNTDDLLQNGVDSAINIDQFATAVPDAVSDCGDALVWTGTDPKGITTAYT